MSSHLVDFEVGTDATDPSLLPGKDKATTGHHYVAVFPKNGTLVFLPKIICHIIMVSLITFGTVPFHCTEDSDSSEKHESSRDTTSGQEAPTAGSRATIEGEEASIFLYH
jgi:hypothetical protein